MKILISYLLQYRCGVYLVYNLARSSEAAWCEAGNGEINYFVAVR